MKSLAARPNRKSKRDTQQEWAEGKKFEVTDRNRSIQIQTLSDRILSITLKSHVWFQQSELRTSQ